MKIGGGKFVKLSVDDQGLRDLFRKLNGKLNTKPLMQSLAGIMMDAVEENFAQEGRPRWQPLAVATLFNKKKSAIVGKKGKYKASFEKELKSRKILQLSGQLAASIVEAVDANSAAVGTNKKYARIHQLGGMAGRGRKVKIPARPFLKLTSGDTDKMKREIAEFLEVK